ncbi:indole-3-glycerol-phosphate synthase [Candidatus Micrarchaeota archaeon]|nr:indole-3-glycerol-phosphate synthase [Candidatus Micrarchaeota archaeon]
MSFLDEVVSGVRQNMKAGHYDVPEGRANLGIQPRGSNWFQKAFQDGFGIIAEIKPNSPSAGKLYSGDIGSLAMAYARGGATALSVLCEGTRFGGSPQNLDGAKAAGIPLLAKDFVVSTKQVESYAAHGADAVLMIQELFDRKKTDAPREEMIQAAHEMGLCVLLEAHATEAVLKALESDADFVGTNNRSLDDLSMNPLHYLNVISEIGPEKASQKPMVAESGFSTKSDVELAKANGFAGVLVGTSLLKSKDAEAAVRALQ